MSRALGHLLQGRRQLRRRRRLLAPRAAARRRACARRARCGSTISRALARIAPGVDRRARRAARRRASTIRALARAVCRAPIPPTSSSRRSAAACPTRYVDAMARRRRPPAWFVLEYLSAEPWVERRARPAVAASATAAGAPLLVSRIHRRRPAACCASAGSSTRATRSARCRGAHARLWASLGLPAPVAGEIARVALLLSESRAAGAARRVGRRRRPRDAASCPKASPPARSTRGPAATCRIRGHRSRAAASTLHAIPFVARTTTTGCSGRATSTSCAARTRSCARSGRRGRSSGTSTRRRSDAHCAKLDAFLDRYAAALDAGVGGGAARDSGDAWNGAARRRPIGAAWRDFAARAPALDGTRERVGGASSPRCPSSPTGLVKAACDRL